METEQENTIEEEATAPEQDGATPGPVAEIMARLISKEAEVANMSRELADKDELIGRLNQSLNAAVIAYRESTVKLHRDVPEELIEGESVSAVDESLKRAMTLVARVKSGLAKAAPPLVAATRSRLSEGGGLSAEDKIRRGLQR